MTELSDRGLESHAIGPSVVHYKPEGFIMSGDTVITVKGNLTAAPELRYTPAGVPVASFTVASTPRVFDRRINE